MSLAFLLQLIGLGNPGSRKTRHSVGHWFVHRFAQHLGLVAQRMADSTNGDLDGGSTAHNSKLHAMNFVEDKSLKCSVADAGGQVDPRFLCLMSSTYMNTSGTAAKLVVNKLNFEPRQLCVVCDGMHACTRPNFSTASTINDTCALHVHVRYRH